MNDVDLNYIMKVGQLAQMSMCRGAVVLNTREEEFFCSNCQ